MSTEPPTGPLALPTALRVDKACDRFEAAWRAGPPPSIEEALEGWEGPERLVLLRELALLDLDYRRANGTPCGPEGYALRFPGWDSLVDGGTCRRFLPER